MNTSLRGRGRDPEGNNEDELDATAAMGAERGREADEGKCDRVGGGTDVRRDEAAGGDEEKTKCLAEGR